jgi:alkanesulfonate monooxygenase
MFSTCPASSDATNGGCAQHYRQEVRDVARWSERAGCAGMLIYTDNTLVDPWLVAQIVLESTNELCPLVAVQPINLHPYAVAKKVTSCAALYGRRTLLNMVSGGFRNDLLALGDPTPHDRRYERLVEYTAIVQGLLRGDAPVTSHGAFYQVDKLRLTPPLARDLLPDVFVSGSSSAGFSAAIALGAIAVKYPQPAAEDEGFPDGAGGKAIRVGIIAREDDTRAWSVARQRFPGDRRGELLHQLAMKISDSVWHRQLSAIDQGDPESPYWLFPFKNYKTMCPYLVGSYRRVGAELARYRGQGVRRFILDVPPNEEELWHTRAAFATILAEAVS